MQGPQMRRLIPEDKVKAFMKIKYWERIDAGTANARLIQEDKGKHS